MIIKFNLIKLSIFSALVILFPLVQNQWLNLYLFDENNLTIYKLLYYLSGLIFPLIVTFTSLNNFTVFKFINKKTNKRNHINGKSLLVIVVLSLIILSTLICIYVLINYKLLYTLFKTNNTFLIDIDIYKYFYFVLTISILLVFKKIKFTIKKILLVNFFSISLIFWYLKVNNILFTEIYFTKLFKFENLEFINIFFLLSIELIYYLWSYISHDSYLSDWNIPLPYKTDLVPVVKIVFFYLMVIIYYSLLSN